MEHNNIIEKLYIAIHVPIKDSKEMEILENSQYGNEKQKEIKNFTIIENNNIKSDNGTVKSVDDPNIKDYHTVDNDYSKDIIVDDITVCKEDDKGVMDSLACLTDGDKTSITKSLNDVDKYDFLKDGQSESNIVNREINIDPLLLKDKDLDDKRKYKKINDNENDNDIIVDDINSEYDKFKTLLSYIDKDRNIKDQNVNENDLDEFDKILSSIKDPIEVDRSKCNNTDEILDNIENPFIKDYHVDDDDERKYNQDKFQNGHTTEEDYQVDKKECDMEILDNIDNPFIKDYHVDDDDERKYNQDKFQNGHTTEEDYQVDKKECDMEILDNIDNPFIKDYHVDDDDERKYNQDKFQNGHTTEEDYQVDKKECDMEILDNIDNPFIKDYHVDDDDERKYNQDKFQNGHTKEEDHQVDKKECDMEILDNIDNPFIKDNHVDDDDERKYNQDKFQNGHTTEVDKKECDMEMLDNIENPFIKDSHVDDDDKRKCNQANFQNVYIAEEEKEDYQVVDERKYNQTNFQNGRTTEEDHQVDKKECDMEMLDNIENPFIKDNHVDDDDKRKCNQVKFQNIIDYQADNSEYEEIDIILNNLKDLPIMEDHHLSDISKFDKVFNYLEKFNTKDYKSFNDNVDPSMLNLQAFKPPMVYDNLFCVNNSNTPNNINKPTSFSRTDITDVYSCIINGLDWNGYKMLNYLSSFPILTVDEFNNCISFLYEKMDTHYKDMMNKTMNNIFSLYKRDKVQLLYNENRTKINVQYCRISIPIMSIWHIVIYYVIEEKYGKILDIEIMSNYCPICQNCTNTKIESHFCPKNVNGDIEYMEKLAHKIINSRGTERNVEYSHKGEPYLINIASIKDQTNDICINELCSKFTSSLYAVRKAVYNSRKIKENKPTGERGVRKRYSGFSYLTKNVITKLSKAYKKAVSKNLSNGFMCMTQDIWQTFYHESSCDENHNHTLCPKGVTSRCFYNRAMARKKPVNHYRKKLCLSNKFDDSLLGIIKGIYNYYTTKTIFYKHIKYVPTSPIFAVNKQIQKYILALKEEYYHVNFISKVATLEYNNGVDGNLLNYI
uniref:Uncharacterized protein n=1 Tax=Trachysalambria curvirostris majanivirus TaxID=2984281 RepID=A0A9C7C009_9VIRU|nr:MAG: hypothetical protein [Trachysalambria curvirostris majanivirus]